jgi:hypothetical protein
MKRHVLLLTSVLALSSGTPAVAQQFPAGAQNTRGQMVDTIPVSTICAGGIPCPSATTLPTNAAQETGGNLATIASNTAGIATAANQAAGNSSLSTIATYDAPFLGEVALTVGTPDSQARRSLKAICTAAGNVSVTYSDSSTGTWAVVVGTQTFPIAITTVNSATATCTYFNLK